MIPLSTIILRAAVLLAACALPQPIVPTVAHGIQGTDAYRATPATVASVVSNVPQFVDPEEVRFQNGDLKLGGLFFVPKGRAPFPAVVFIPGSGPSNRENYWTRAVVDVFVESGIAVLFPDKRGSDASEGDWRTADFEDLAGDALAGVEFVGSRPDILEDCIGLVGLSQGGRIVPIAAGRSNAVAFVVNIVGAATALKEQISWEMYHTFREEHVGGAALQEALILQVLAEGYVEGTVEWEQYDAARRAAMDGPGGDVARGFPPTPDAWQWAFFRLVIDSDPIPHWRNVTQPILVLYGEDDRNAPVVTSAYRLVRVWQELDHPDATLRVIPDTGHGLWEASGDPHYPVLHPDAVTILRDWVMKRIAPVRN
jgi:uncharacterized protein